MCDTCTKINHVIEQYRKARHTMSDQVVIDRAEELMAELEKQKIVLHPAWPHQLTASFPVSS